MVKPPKAPPSFVSRNLVTIVMVPTIIAVHFGWSAMQKNRSLVKEHEEIDLPVVTVSFSNTICFHLRSFNCGISFTVLQILYEKIKWSRFTGQSYCC